jgi:hypothetical protein
MGSFSGGKSKPLKGSVPFLQAGLTDASNVFQQGQGNLNDLTKIATDGVKNGNGFQTSPYVDNAQAAARTISNGYFLGSNPGQQTYDRLQSPGHTGSMFNRGGSRDPSMGLLGDMANDNSGYGGDQALTSLQTPGTNPADRFASSVAGGQYLNHQPSADLYSRMMDPSAMNGNPFLQSVIDQTNEDVTRNANRQFASRGMGAGLSTPFVDVLSRNLANNEGQLRYTNYNDASNRALQAGGQSDAAFSAERGRMDASNGLLANNYNAGQDRSLAAAQALNQSGQAAAQQRLGAAQSLGGQYTAGANRDLSAFNANQDRALDAAKAGDASQANQVSQMLQALGLTGQLEQAGYADWAPRTDLLKTAATIPYLGLDAYQTALSNLSGAGRTQTGPGIGSVIGGGLASGLGSALGNKAFGSGG